jgi:RNA polymerase sigma factor (sigma-70 family)
MQRFTHDPAEDVRLAVAAKNGDAEALGSLVRRHYAWVLHIAQRMLWNRADAEDATQEILTTAVTKLGSFEGRSEFRTWLYRIAANHLVDRCRSAKSFHDVARTLDEIPDREAPGPIGTQVETAVLIEEAKIACTTGMLLCLEPRRRLAFLLGELLEVTADVGAEMLGTSPANFRQILSRARRELYAFLHRQCGLVNEQNRCRCAHKTAGFIERGFVSPDRLQFVTAGLAKRSAAASARLHEIRDLDRRYAEIFREQPLLSTEDEAARLTDLLRLTGVQHSLELDE